MARTVDRKRIESPSARAKLKRGREAHYQSLVRSDSLGAQSMRPEGLRFSLSERLAAYDPPRRWHDGRGAMAAHLVDNGKKLEIVKFSSKPSAAHHGNLHRLFMEDGRASAAGRPIRIVDLGADNFRPERRVRQDGLKEHLVGDKCGRKESHDLRMGADVGKQILGGGA
jgi:hypothetical protein